MDVGVVGAGGRMGAEVCRAVLADGSHRLVAAVDPARAGIPLSAVIGPSAGALVVAGDLDALRDAGARVVVDFTVADAARATLAWCATAGMHTVVGTSGLGPADLEALGRLYPTDGGLGCIVAPNFGIGAVLTMRFAEMAAPWFETAEIVELHHDGKRDAPSGTALATATRMAAASDRWAADPTEIETVPGARGAQGPGGIRIHSVRLRGLVAHQEVLLGTAGETLTLRHDSLDRASFMPGVLLAVGAVAGRPGLTVGLDALMFT